MKIRGGTLSSSQATWNLINRGEICRDATIASAARTKALQSLSTVPQLEEWGYTARRFYVDVNKQRVARHGRAPRCENLPLGTLRRHAFLLTKRMWEWLHEEAVELNSKQKCQAIVVLPPSWYLVSASSIQSDSFSPELREFLDVIRYFSVNVACMLHPLSTCVMFIMISVI